MNWTGPKKVVWLSGEICQAAGIYFSDTCGHPIKKEFVVNDAFTRCPSCHSAVRWMRWDTDVVKQARNFDFGRLPFTLPGQIGDRDGFRSS